MLTDQWLINLDRYGGLLEVDKGASPSPSRRGCAFVTSTSLSEAWFVAQRSRLCRRAEHRRAHWHGDPWHRIDYPIRAMVRALRIVDASGRVRRLTQGMVSASRRLV